MINTSPAGYTVDELFAVCIARQIAIGKWPIAAQGLATPMVMAGYLLAKCTTMPDLRFIGAIGQGMIEDWLPLGIASAESMWLGKAQIALGFVTAAADVLPRLPALEFFRPAQVDPRGNFNNVAIGADPARPRLRLPGVGGIPDVTVTGHGAHLYVTRHSRVTFVERCDVISGLNARYLISDFGQFDWEGGTMRLTHLHPGVTSAQVQAKTGFPLIIAPDLAETVPPADHELDLLRTQIDPLNVRKLEILGGAARRDLLRAILESEGAL